jgi:hypothetical protein
MRHSARFAVERGQPLGRELDAGLEAGHAKQRVHVIPERHVPPPADSIRGMIPRIEGHIGKRSARHVSVGAHGGLEQRRLEGPDVLAARARALREEHHRGALLERVAHAVDDARQIAQPAAVDEQRSDAPRQPADRRPASNLGLRHEDGRCEGQQREDIDIAQMICNEQHRRCRGLTLEAQSHSDQPRSAPGPAAAQRHAPRGRGIGSDERDQLEGQQHQRPPDEAEDAQDGADVPDRRHRRPRA